MLPVAHLQGDLSDPLTKQMIAERAVLAIEQAMPQLDSDPDAIVVGVTSQDLNVKSDGWKFTMNFRYGRVAVVSGARLHGLPWYAGSNPEVFAVRLRKMVTKNLALMRYPVTMSTDVSSALASGVFTTEGVDEMGQRFAGEYGSYAWIAEGSPCSAIIQGPGKSQHWNLDCNRNPPQDSRMEIFENYPGVQLFVMSRTDFAFAGLPSFAFQRVYRPHDDRSRAFGMGNTDSFDIFPVGDSQRFSYMELILPSGAPIYYDRTSPGTGYVDAKYRARAYEGSPFSLSTIAWKDSGWDLVTQDGWTYRFPSSGEGRTWQQSALIGIRSATGQTFTIERSSSGDLRKIAAPDGSAIEFVCDAQHRIVAATRNNGRAVRYEYDSAGRLAHVQDSETGDEFYEYDKLNQMTSVLDGQHKPLLVNDYGYLGELRAQTLADGTKMVYENGYDERRNLTFFKATLPNGYSIRWMGTRNGFLRGLPQAPQRAAAGAGADLGAAGKAGSKGADDAALTERRDAHP